jgi:hypothetical protein
MPALGYIPKNPRPNLREQGYQRVAEILHRRMKDRRGAFYCFVNESGSTFLRSVSENRRDMPAASSWVGTYSKDTPLNYIEDNLIDRLRELSLDSIAA